jgi:hypothetical protein
MSGAISFFVILLVKVDWVCIFVLGLKESHRFEPAIPWLPSLLVAASFMCALPGASWWDGLSLVREI